jgi:hypothetical protein
MSERVGMHMLINTHFDCSNLKPALQGTSTQRAAFFREKKTVS